MIKNLLAFAATELRQDEPQKAMFETLPNLSLDSSGHLYLAFDAYCRYLWELKTGHDQIKSAWSYNQASFPRADPGKFYDLFKGENPEGIQLKLHWFDKELGPYRHETFSLWHMAAHWFRHKKEFNEMEYFLQLLCVRVYELGNEYDFSQDRQLNFDCMMSFSLLGDVRETRGDLVGAMIAFDKAVEIRSQHVSSDDWDPGKAGALRRLESIAIRLREESKANDCKEQLGRMYASQEEKDRKSRAHRYPTS